MGAAPRTVNGTDFRFSEPAWQEAGSGRASGRRIVQAAAITAARSEKSEKIRAAPASASPVPAGS